MMKRMTYRLHLTRAVLALLGLTLLVPGAVLAQTSQKLTLMVPMRDGVRLATDVVLPAGTGPWPVALTRSLFGRQNLGALTRLPISGLVQNGIAVVSQDVRGRFDSEGRWLHGVDEGWGKLQDGLDTVLWIRQQPWCNGKIATFGFGYSGHNQLLLAGTGPEGIVGQSVTSGWGSAYHGFFQQGAFSKGAEFGLLSFGYQGQALSLVRQNPRYNTLWATVDFSTRVERVRWPMVLVAGWFDVGNQTQGTLDAFTQLQERGGVGSGPHLVLGPWTHHGAAGDADPRQAGELRFPANAAYPSDAPTDLQWLSYWLTGQPAIPDSEPAVRYYVMGDTRDPQAPGNLWRSTDRWPPPSQPLRLYFTADGALVPQPPATPSVREYDYDPLRPVFTLGDALNGPVDQRRVENWPEVLLFTTPPLAEPLEVTGRLTVRLYAATSARDTDFTAKLTDVYPDGRSIYLNDGIVRARFRESVSRATAVTPGKHYAFDIDLGSTSLIFNRGHRIRVAISSSNYPRYELNRNNGQDWPDDQALPSVIAHQTIFLGGQEASHIVLPEVPGGGRP
jgi:predicted acyl esterase